MVPTPLLLLAAAAVGVDTGWTKLDSGGYEYVIQITPEQLDSLRNGGEFGSDLPAGTGAIRSYKIVVGTGPLVNQGVPLPPEAQVNYKPPVEEPSTAGRKGDIFSAGREQANPQQGDGEAATVAEEEKPLLDTPKALADRIRAVDVFRADQSAASATVAESETKTEADDGHENEGASSGDEADGPNTPATEESEPTSSAELKYWNTFLIVLTIMLGSLNGWFGFLAWDFRNRYLELLHDLDAQPNPVEEPSERFANERETPEEDADDGGSRRDQRGAMAYVGRKPVRHGDDEAYDEE